MTEQHDNWERGVLERLAMAALVEQRRVRRWNVFFKLASMAMTLLILFVIIVLVAGENAGVGDGEHTALVDMQGIIQAEGDVCADDVILALQSAFENKGTRGVVLRINSPGGSPVHAGQINDEMKRLRRLYPETPLYVVVDDICASGGYYVAAAGDEIYVDKASIVGSIGVLMDGFGFTGTLEKLGIERRLVTAGENKGMLDPFSPSNPADVEHAKLMLGQVHQQFIDVVRAGRGDRLKETPDTFSGKFWTGQESIELGLADGYGTVESVARNVIKVEDIVDFTVEVPLVDRLAEQMGAGAARVMPGFASRLMHFRFW